MDTITLDNISPDNPSIPAYLTTIPEKIGYLREIGLDYGWGPTSMVEWIIEHFHIYGGLPWWGSIAATAMALRLVLLPWYIKSSDIAARQMAIVSLTKPVTNKMNAAKAAGDQEAMQIAFQELMLIRKRAGVSMPKQMRPMLLQAVFGFCGFRLLRAAAELPVPAFKTDGPWWLMDLTVQDPYLILPFVMAMSIHLVVRLGGESGGAPPPPGMKKFLLYGMPTLAFVATGYQSAAVAVWFASGGALGILQAQLLQRPKIREALGIAPLYKPTKEEGQAENPLLAYFKPKDEREASRQASSSGKNTSYMRTSYQSPSSSRSTSSAARSSSNVIDVKARPSTSFPTTSSPSSTKRDDMVTPSGAPSSAFPAEGSANSGGGIFSGAKGFISKQVDKGAKMLGRSPPTPESKAKAEKANFKKAAQAYEKRAKEMEKRRRREGGR